MMLNKYPVLIISVGLILLLASVNAKKTSLNDKGQYSGNNVMGFGILQRLPGLWNGPVSSTTPAGSFDAWYVDFRPVLPGQISQYSTLNADTSNFISLFVVKHGGRLKIAMRTEGVFRKKGCVTYEVVDSVNEDKGYYRFSDFQSGDKRAYTEFTFKNGDELLMEVYTSKFNKVHPLELHSQWKAKRGDAGAASEAVSYHRFPQPQMVKDFSHVFGNMPESIFFTFEKDPYKSSSQPYVGEVTVDIAIDKNISTTKNNEIFLLLTTGPIFDGLKYKKDNLKYISRYVYLPIKTKRYTFKNIHPGTYYLYSYIDINNDRKHLSGDFMCSKVNNQFTLGKEGSINVDTAIDLKIP